jgi:hypothetical protein
MYPQRTDRSGWERVNFSSSRTPMLGNFTLGPLVQGRFDPAQGGGDPSLVAS